MLKWLLGLLDKGLKWSYGFYSRDRLWRLATLWSGVVEKFAVGSFLIGIFQGKMEGLIWGLISMFLCSLFEIVRPSK